MLKYAIMVLGLWVLLSPWILGFADISLAKWSNASAGTAIFLSALWFAFGKKENNEN